MSTFQPTPVPPSIDLFQRSADDSAVIESPWRFHMGVYRNASPVACIMKQFSLNNNCPELALRMEKDIAHFQTHLARDMKIGKLDITKLVDIAKFFNITIYVRHLTGHMDKFAPRRKADDVPIATVNLLFDGMWFELIMDK